MTSRPSHTVKCWPTCFRKQSRIWSAALRHWTMSDAGTKKSTMREPPVQVVPYSTTRVLLSGCPSSACASHCLVAAQASSHTTRRSARMRLLIALPVPVGLLSKKSSGIRPAGRPRQTGMSPCSALAFLPST